MPKCLCKQIPDILDRLELLERKENICGNKQQTGSAQLQQRERELEAREQDLQSRAQSLEKAAVQLQEMGKKMTSSQSDDSELKQQVQKQQQVIEVLSQIQGQTNKLFSQVYVSLSPLLDLPQLQIQEQDPMALLQGLANLAEGFMKVAPLLEICKKTMEQAEQEQDQE
ncbi:hypothetical protein SS50377_26127 [Spironucleus salmonicida]|uniref:Uncharacterized protein n=1 Tax=Spironucleus salmonicida TaxID=348837 RepID=V6LQ11_9EUKA|nr:hypothetical protein SS50377_26127 [Spironucleus salmonicida]|eukprot:EST46333.1 Hypothetical protein SS50377_13644 [Spironucleus salmonicida]